jgi:outer membrane protein assembly factor BamB
VKLESGRANDWPFQGVASSPLVENRRLYYTRKRGVVFCLDIDGFHDNENDGPVTDEKLTGEFDADVIWSFDMMEEVGSYPHNMSNSSPVIWGDLVYLSTSNGQDESHVLIASPRAPSIISLYKNTRKLVWEDNSVEDRILHGQWSTPSVGMIGGVLQTVSAQGDGWVRGYEAESGKKLWEFDTNPKDSVWPRTRNELIATPVIYQDRVYIANGQDPEHGEGVGHFYAIDATKRGNITESGRVWQFDKIRRAISTAAIFDGLVYAADFSGYLHCLDAKTGTEYWTHDVLAAVWGSPMVADGKVYLGDEDGDIVVLATGKEKKVIAEMNMGSAVYSTIVPAHGMLFVNNRSQLFAIAAK